MKAQTYKCNRINTIRNVNKMDKNRTIINYRHKRRKFQMALLFFLYLCHYLSIAHCNEIGKEVVSPAFDLTTAKIREPKDVAPPARLHDLKNLHENSEDEEEDEDEPDESDDYNLKTSRKYLNYLNLLMNVLSIAHQHFSNFN